MSEVMPATDAEIAEIKEWARATTIRWTGNGKRLVSLIARLDLEVAARKDDAERIKGLRDKLAGLAIVYDNTLAEWECHLCGAECSQGETLQHAPSCLLWKRPT